MPPATPMILLAMTRRRPNRGDFVISGLLLAANALLLGGALLGPGDFVLFACASISLSFYAVTARLWSIDPCDFFLAVPVVNAVAVVPLWLMLDGRLDAPVLAIALQASYQGILVTLGAVTLPTFAIRRIGPMAVSVILAAVPFVAAFLAVPILGEPVTALHVLALTICTIGIGLCAWKGRKPSARRAPKAA